MEQTNFESCMRISLILEISFRTLTITVQLEPLLKLNNNFQYQIGPNIENNFIYI